MRVFELVFVAILVCRAGASPRCDPAPSWLAYTKANGSGRTIASVRTSWIVPAYPAARDVPSAPGFWFGIEPAEPNACDLIQPILAYDYTVPEEYVIFLGYFEWDNYTWWASSTGTVRPGDLIEGFIELVNPNLYRQGISCKRTGFSIMHERAVEQGRGPYSDTYFVIEHQPSDCSQMPSSGGMVFSNITIEYVGTNQTIDWTAAKFQDVCDVVPSIISQTEVGFKWQTQ